MSLLSVADKAAIRAAIKLVTDTFMVSPVTYFVAGSDVDVWEEGRQSQVFTPYSLKALEEYEESDKRLETADGVFNYERVKLTFNFEDLMAEGLIDTSFRYLIKPENDYFMLRGLVYRIEDVYYDGPLDAQSVLLVVKGKIAASVPAGVTAPIAGCSSFPLVLPFRLCDGNAQCSSFPLVLPFTLCNGNDGWAFPDPLPIILE